MMAILELTEVVEACPFCGGAASDLRKVGGDAPFMYWIACDDDDCRTCGPDDQTEAGAVAKWNKRAVAPWQRIADAPPDQTVLCCFYDSAGGSWVYDIVFEPSPLTWTYWQPLPDHPQ